jgi:hypothetical protein
MSTHRKIIWGGVLLLIGAAIIFVLYEEQKNAQFSVVGQSALSSTSGQGGKRMQRYPEFANEGVPVTTRGTAPHGITLRSTLPFLQNEHSSIFAIRSSESLFPDGTSDHFEALYATSGKTYRVLVGREGVISNTAIAGSPVQATPLPENFPDSPDALVQLTANPYFAKAEVIGIALYFEEREKRWSYMVRTNLGDVSILLPEMKTVTQKTKSK